MKLISKISKKCFLVALLLSLPIGSCTRLGSEVSGPTPADNSESERESILQPSTRRRRVTDSNNTVVISSSSLSSSSYSSSSSSSSLGNPLFSGFSGMSENIGSFLSYGDVFNGLVPTRHGVEPYFNSAITWKRFADQEGISLSSSKDVYNKMYTGILVRKLLIGKVQLGLISILGYERLKRRIVPYIWDKVFDKLCFSHDPGALFNGAIYEAALSLESIHRRDARDLISWSHLHKKNMRECNPGVVCSFLMHPEALSHHASLLRKAIVDPYFTKHQQLNMAYRLGTLVRSASDFEGFVEPEAVRLNHYEAAVRGYLEAGDYNVKSITIKRAAYQESAELAEIMLIEAGDSAIAGQYELASKAYNYLGSSLPKGESKQNAYRRLAELAETMFRAAAGDRATAEQYELASEAYTDLANSLPKGESKQNAYRRLAELAETMLRAAGDRATAQQYEWASKAYYQLGDSLPEGADEIAAYRRSTELAEQMLRAAGDRATAGQYEWSLHM